MNTIVVITTVGSEEQGDAIARELVARRQAACVNVIPGIKSVYRWQGEICRDSEYLLVIKTAAEKYESVATTIHEIHQYDVPEILAFDIERGDASYLAWIAACLE